MTGIGTNFLDTLLAARAAAPVIAELKLRDGAGRDLAGGRRVEDIVAGYLAAGACCLSVVTGRWFGGDRELLRRVSACAGGLPILRKDFITSRAAIEESAALGASAVLLTTHVARGGTRPGSLADLIAITSDLGLTPFVEIDSASQLEAVPERLCGIIAINNNDILEKERSGEGPARAERLFVRVAAHRPAAIVAASAISDVATAASLVARGFDGLLIGTALMRDPGLLGRMTSGARHRIDPLCRNASEEEGVSTC